jgi:hypothetical protein
MKNATKKKAARPRRRPVIKKKRARARRRVATKTVKKNPTATRKAKTNRWYKGPRGVKIRVRRSRGKFVVDVKK